MANRLQSESRYRTVTNLIALVFLSSLVCSPVNADESMSAEQLNFFESKIRPVLIEHCYSCHSEESGNVRGGLKLDTRALTRIGGTSGPAVVPGNHDESLLLSAIRYEDWEMPPSGKLSDETIADFETWIEMGAPDPRENTVTAIRPTISKEDISDARENFWAYQSPKSSPLPDVTNERWCQNDIDRFILRKLEDSQLQPADDARSHNVARRLYFDLIGLPPSPEQLTKFAKRWKSNPAAAVESVADELLAKEQFGERWGRHWLDIARYAESTGREVNFTYPHAWRYRDFVIDSFNEDKPFDEFVQQQIAGDLMPVQSDENWAENLIATSFLAIGSKNLNEPNRAQFQADLVDEQIDAVSRVFLGTSVACARCHDHKFDPIPQTDYYALAGVFKNMTTYFGNPASEYGRFRIAQRKQISSLIRLPIDDPNPYDKNYTKNELQEIHDEIERITTDVAASRRSGSNSIRNVLRQSNRLSELSDLIAVVDKNGQPISYTMGVQERDEPSDARLLVRGEIDQASDSIPRGFPQVLCETPVTIDSSDSGRLELARWIGSDRNSLTARVFVNRVWEKLIGQGIVASTNNFGSTGIQPSHPELLDHLATKFVDSDWSVKQLIREIITSRTYRMSTDFNSEAHQSDPDNKLLWRANPKRLDAEAIRDSMLFVAGTIDLQRPRGSEVAKAGYARVRNGVIGNSRDKIQKLAREIAMERNRNNNQLTSNSRRRRSINGARNNAGGNGNSNNRRTRRIDNQRGTDTARMSRQQRNAAVGEAAKRIERELDMEDSNIRSVYLPIVRNEIPRALEVFDFADASAIIGTRETSHTSIQSLYMLNNQFVLTQSDQFARRVLSEVSSTSDRIQRAFELALGRKPTAKELQATKQFAVRMTNESENTDPFVVFSAFCQSLLASAEFRMLD